MITFRLNIHHIFLLMGIAIPFWLSAEVNFSAAAKQAEKLFHEKLYGDALPLYSELSNLSSDKELKIQLMLRLATCYLEERHPQATLNLLSSLDSQFLCNRSLYLMSMAYRQLGQPSQALNLLQQCSPANSQYNQSLINLEKGYHLMHMGDLTNAQTALQSISHPPILYDLAQLQLAKIFLLRQQFNEALEILLLSSPQNHLLNRERIYLKGWALLSLHQESQAALCFEKLLLTNSNESSILSSLILSYLRQALTTQINDLNALKSLFSKAERALQTLLPQAPIESSYLLLSDFYLIKAKCLNDSDAYAQAQHLLDQSNLFSSQEGFNQALLKRAAAAPSYLQRSQLYQQLINRLDYPSALCAKAWFLKGLNDLEEGIRNQNLQPFSINQVPFEQAAQAFMQAAQLNEKAALKYLAFTYALLPDKIHAQNAWQILLQLIEDQNLFEHPEEIYCLSAWIALRLNDHEMLQKAKMWLQQSQITAIDWKMRCLKLEGLICLQLEEWQQADGIFLRLLEDDAYTSTHGEALFWQAYSAGKQNQLTLKQECLQRAYTQNTQSPYAPIAYFQFYSYREYMQGKRKAIKHLQAMPTLFPHHPLLISAHYLIGLSHKKDHLSEEGQLLKRKDWTAAIDAFQLAESTFDDLFASHLIPSSDLIYFTQIRYHAQLERAKTNFAIAQHATGGKKQIYLEYAEEVFKELIQDFINPESLANKAITQSSCPKIWAEAEFQLAKTYQEKNEWMAAEATLNRSLEYYQKSHMTQGYGPMRVWYAKGKIEQRRASYAAAIQCFLEAEKASQEYLRLSPHEKLDLWIQQSLCYKALNEPEHAMRLLSRVINEDVISPLRMKAMFLRAEIYELQERPELAIKQLEAAASKGGEWAQKAKEKLEQVYGY